MPAPTAPSRRCMSAKARRASTPACRPGAVPRRRCRIAALLGAGVLINYIDRVNLSVAAPGAAENGEGPAEA
jgi:hypothetical protein